MENKKKESSTLRRIWNVAWNEFVRWILNPRMILFFCLILFIDTYVTEKMAERSAVMGVPLGIWEIFLAVGNSTELCVAIPAVYLFLMGDFPRKDGNMLLYVQRAGKYNWLMGQMLAAVLSAAAYLSAIAVCCLLMSAGHWTFTNRWSDVVTKYPTLFPDDRNHYISELITGRLYNNFSPVQAFLYSFTLLFLLLWLLAVIKMTAFLLGNEMLGIAAGGFLIGSGWTLNQLDTGWKWLFPMAHAIEWQHCDEVFRTMEVSMTQSYLYFAAGILIFFTAGVLLVGRYNFGYTRNT